jgi:hypothetical protein
MILVRFLLFLALATVAVSGLLYLFKRDRRYLRFIGQVIRYTIYLLVGVLLFFASSGWSSCCSRQSAPSAGRVSPRRSRRPSACFSGPAAISGSSANGANGPIYLMRRRFFGDGGVVDLHAHRNCATLQPCV